MGAVSSRTIRSFTSCRMKKNKHAAMVTDTGARVKNTRVTRVFKMNKVDVSAEILSFHQEHGFLKYTLRTLRCY
jgi:hypothetical protein